MTKCGWVKDRQKGSHQIWYLPKGNIYSHFWKYGKSNIKFDHF
ncbi:type II toxin-antitoxin system HicA family toxin [Rickettsia koreansis]